MMLKITVRQLVQIFFSEIFGFAPPLGQIHLSEGLKHEDSGVYEFRVAVKGVPYLFSVSQFRRDGYMISSRLFGSKIPYIITIAFCNDGYTVDYIN